MQEEVPGLSLPLGFTNEMQSISSMRKNDITGEQKMVKHGTNISLHQKVGYSRSSTLVKLQVGLNPMLQHLEIIKRDYYWINVVLKKNVSVKTVKGLTQIETGACSLFCNCNFYGCRGIHAPITMSTISFPQSEVAWVEQLNCSVKKSNTKPSCTHIKQLLQKHGVGGTSPLKLRWEHT